MNIDAHDFLTDEQKSQLGTALFEKMLKGINDIKVLKGKGVDISAIVNEEITALFEIGAVYENIDHSAISKAMSKKILAAI